MHEYTGQTRLLVAIDCIIFGFDGEKIKVLLVKRGLEPEKGKWSLMGGFLSHDMSLDNAADSILKKLTGLEGVYLQQLESFGDPGRDPVERTLSVAYFALIDIHKYETQLSDTYHPEWFLQDNLPALIFDHAQMVKKAKKQLKYKAALHPILFELLPERFTIPQLQSLYEGVYDISFDNRNFSRKVFSTGLLIKLEEKDKTNSKKGAWYYKLDKEKYAENFDAFLHFIPNPDKLIMEG
jgi:ADP-ribose pyrophosphatase YjhB (NUDIX family)